MATLKDIRDAIKTTLEAAITSLTVYDTVPDTVNLPAVVVKPVLSNFHLAMGRGSDQWEFDLEVLVSTADLDLGQDALDGFVTGAGSDSIRQAVFNARTLGLSGTDASVSGLTEYGMQTAADIPHIAAVLRLVVVTSGTA
jgi:hypothetical protein